MRRWGAALVAVLLSWRVALAQGAPSTLGMLVLDSGRVTLVASPSDEKLARSLLAAAVAEDSFPGLPRPRQHVLIFVAPDAKRFREWNGNSAPEWGGALAYPQLNRIVMQGHRAPSSAGDPIQVLRHELAHLALHEMLGELPPRWFDEGYASLVAGEVGGDGVVAANLALALRGLPRLDELNNLFYRGESNAQAGYSLSTRAVEELVRADPERGLTLFFQYWKSTQSFDLAVRRAYGITTEQFEARWRSRTRLRYGALALVADVSLGSLVLLLVLGPLWWQRRKRDRERMERLRIADAEQERRDRESALAELLGTGELPPQGGEGNPPERTDEGPR